MKDPDSELHPEKAESMHVELKVSFKDTQAGQELEKDLHQIEQEKALKTPQRPQTAARRKNFSGTSDSYLSKRLQSASKGNQKQFHMTSRPFSAKTDFQSGITRNPYGRRDFSNRMMSSHAMNKTPSMKTLPNRPQTAVGTHNNMRSSMSIGSMRTITPSYGGKPRQKKKQRPPVNDQIFDGYIDTDGCVVFENVPRTTCHLTVNENDFFKSAYKFVDLPNELEKDGKIDIYLPIERQDAYTTTIYMIKPNKPKNEEDKASDAYTDEGEGKTYFENLSLRAVLLELFEEKGSQHSQSESDLESEVDYEEEFEQTEDYYGAACYKCKLVPGKYMVIAKGREIKEFSEIIRVEEQITELHFTPETLFSKEVTVKAYDAITGNPLPNVLLRLRKSNSKISSEGLTKSDGEFSYIIDSNCPHFLEVERKGFIPYHFEFNQTKGNENIDVVKVPMFPIEKVKPVSVPNPEHPEEETEVKPNILRTILVTDDEVSNSVIVPHFWGCVVNPENNEEEEFRITNSYTSHEQDDVKVEYTDHGEFGKLITAQTVVKETTKYYRICARISSAQNTDVNESNLDQNFRNTLQDHNTKMLIFNENKLISIVYIPNFTTDCMTWDIGFYNPVKAKFLKVNS